VPTSVPLLRHSSSPNAGSIARKSRTPFRLTSCEGLELPPGSMSRTSMVPPGVPSLFQSSSPDEPSFATKNNVPFTSVSDAG
jgi:hypothetical protein